MLQFAVGFVVTPRHKKEIMQSACQNSAYAHYARTPVLQLKQRTDDIFNKGGVSLL